MTMFEAVTSCVTRSQVTVTHVAPSLLSTILVLLSEGVTSSLITYSRQRFYDVSKMRTLLT